jgi:hypothetical protein
MAEEAKRTRREGLAEFAEDAVGFGGQELRLTRDLFVRPRAVMDAYDAHGSTAGGLYPKPLRYYLTLNGLYLLVIAVLGGFERALTRGEGAETLGRLADLFGKNRQAFLADLDQWYSILAIPMFAIFIGGGAYLLIRKWSPGDDRQDFRQTFTYLNAYTVLALPLGIGQLLFDGLTNVSLILTFVLLALTYVRVGAGRWWRTPAGAWGKGLLLMLVLAFSTGLAATVAMSLAMFGAGLLP